MTLAEQLFSMMQANSEAMQLTDLITGTVTAVAPLRISISTAMEDLREEVLYLTESVVEKKIPILAHRHDVSGLKHKHTVTGLDHSHTLNGAATSSSLSGSYQTSEEMAGSSFPSSAALENIQAVEHGKPLPVESGYIILNRGLSVGDKVLLLRVLHGQKFIVLSRIYQ